MPSAPSEPVERMVRFAIRPMATGTYMDQVPVPVSVSVSGSTVIVNTTAPRRTDQSYGPAQIGGWGYDLYVGQAHVLALGDEPPTVKRTRFWFVAPTLAGDCQLRLFAVIDIGGAPTPVLGYVVNFQP